MRIILGVDEAGRGPLAGPVAVGLVAVAEGFDVAREFPGVADSKVLTEGKREEIYELLKARVAQGDARFLVKFGSHVSIDRQGISKVVQRCVFTGVRELAPRFEGVHIYLDGLLKAPPPYAQETIINGDALVPIISLASIAAKVERDRFMKKLSKKFPQYGFDQHKGYGTALHYEKLGEHGPCAIHRMSYVHLDKPVVKE